MSYRFKHARSRKQGPRTTSSILSRP
jgi:hypothetical protein